MTLLLVAINIRQGRNIKELACCYAACDSKNGLYFTTRRPKSKLLTFQDDPRASVILSFTVLVCEWRTVFSNTGLVCLILMIILMFKVEATAYPVLLFFSLFTQDSFDHQPVQEQPEYSYESHY